MDRYEGISIKGKRAVYVCRAGRFRRLPERLDVYNHSPTGFSWGYCGSGPAQLALAICMDVLGCKSLALAVYQEFKRRVVACLEGERWTLEQAQARETIRCLLVMHFLAEARAAEKQSGE